MIFHTRHRHSVVDRLSSKSFVRVEYQLQGMLFITDYRAHSAATSPYLLPINDVYSDVIIIKLTAFIQNEIPYKTCISDYFCIWKITEFMPTCLRGAVFF